MRIAIIDLGTNSVRYDVHQLIAAGGSRTLHREKIMIRLGQGTFLSGKLDRSAIARTLHAFRRFKRLNAYYQVDKILPFGTAALREAADRDNFLTLLSKKTGINVRVISGTEEAKLIALGILSNEKNIKGKYALIDIGGGSTEISICRGKDVLHSASFPLGAARLTQVYLKSIPPKASEIENLRAGIRNALQQLDHDHWPSVNKILGSSGTIRALAKILKKETGQGKIERSRLKDLVKSISQMSPTQLLRVPGMEPKRIDMIQAGAILFEECMRKLEAKSATTTEYSLRHGILEEELRLYDEGMSSHLLVRLEDFYSVARKCGGDDLHLRRTAKLASDLFTKLSSLHKLGREWQVYLVAAAILRESGRMISLTRYPKHSYYIIKNADLPHMEDWELELIAQLCLRQNDAKFEISQLPFKKDRKLLFAFRKLLALLTVVDALATDSEVHIQLKRARVKKGSVYLYISGKGVSELESLSVEVKRKFFEDTFHHSVVAIKA